MGHQRITSPFGTVFVYSDEHPNVFEQVFGPRHPSVSHAPSAIAPMVDIHEDEQIFTVTMDLPGVRKEDIHVSLSDGTLTINAESERDIKNSGHWVRHERRVGKYVRSLELSGPIDANNISAKCKDGVLTLTIPKTAKSETQTVEVH